MANSRDESRFPPPGPGEFQFKVEDRPDWMTEMDIEILAVLNQGLILPPAVIADNIDRSREGVAQRLSALRAGGMVEKEGRGRYTITSKGVSLLSSLVEFG